MDLAQSVRAQMVNDSSTANFSATTTKGSNVLLVGMKGSFTTVNFTHGGSVTTIKPGQIGLNGNYEPVSRCASKKVAAPGTSWVALTTERFAAEGTVNIKHRGTPDQLQRPLRT